MNRNRKLTSAVAALLSVAAAPAFAQTPLEAEYEEAQRLLNAAIVDAVGAVAASAALPDLALPDTAFFNPLRVSADYSVVADEQLEIKTVAEADEAAAPATFRDAGADAFLSRPHGATFINDAETQTLAAGAFEADNPLHWTFHGDRLYLTPAPKGESDLREKRSLSISADTAYLSQADAFRRNNFSAARAEKQ